MTKLKREETPNPTNKEIKNSLAERINRMSVYEEDLKRIAANQKIPVEVAIEFYECKGKIKDNSFLERIESYAD